MEFGIRFNRLDIGADYGIPPLRQGLTDMSPDKPGSSSHQNAFLHHGIPLPTEIGSLDEVIFF